MKKMQTLSTKSLRLSLAAIQACTLAVALFASGASLASPTIKLTETQSEKLKCLKNKTCSKLTTGTYKATLTLDLVTLQQYQDLLDDFGITDYLIKNNIELSRIDFSKGLFVAIKDLTPDQQKALLTLSQHITLLQSTPFAISIGDFSFTNTSNSSYDPNNPKTGSWKTYHTKSVPASICNGSSSNCVKDGTITWAFGYNGVVITFTGSSDKVKGFGQSILAGACVDAAQITDVDSVKKINKKVSVSEAGSVTIGQTTVPFSLTGSCLVNKPADPKNKTNGPFNLMNLKISAK